MLSCIHYIEGVSAEISKSEFDALPESIRGDLQSIASGTTDINDSLYFFIPNRDDAYTICNRVNRHLKQKNNNKIRKLNMHLFSEGIYEKDDIEQLYDAQEGLCYYTGKTLKKKPRNYHIDHIIPISEGGSSWPANLALVLKEVNQEKSYLSKRKYFSLLERRYGKPWLLNQKEFCKKVDLRRRQIDKQRKFAVREQFQKIEDRLIAEFPDAEIEYLLGDNGPELTVNHTSIIFPHGFLRQKKLFNSLAYISNIVRAILFESAK